MKITQKEWEDGCAGFPDGCKTEKRELPVDKNVRDAMRYRWLKKHNCNGLSLNEEIAYLHVIHRKDKRVELDICNIDKVIDDLMRL